MSYLTPSLSIAASAAALALSAAAPTAPAFAAKSAKVVPCYGVNDCKGQSDCKSAKNDCKGQNGCKGQGFKDLTKEQCANAGGKLSASAAINTISVRAVAVASNSITSINVGR
jgi:uncharacterized membrane protein